MGSLESIQNFQANQICFSQPMFPFLHSIQCQRVRAMELYFVQSVQKERLNECVNKLSEYKVPLMYLWALHFDRMMIAMLMLTLEDRM